MPSNAACGRAPRPRNRPAECSRTSLPSTADACGSAVEGADPVPLAPRAGPSPPTSQAAGAASQRVDEGLQLRRRHGVHLPHLDRALPEHKLDARDGLLHLLDAALVIHLLVGRPKLRLHGQQHVALLNQHKPELVQVLERLVAQLRCLPRAPYVRLLLLLQQLRRVQKVRDAAAGRRAAAAGRHAPRAAQRPAAPQQLPGHQPRRSG
mmetsp:Transcript_26732/g.68653  ORF Transcript_26732/g.68653 Transcript_26732/m.68653 type:complete len:208 (-) Transcript_26732:248-871(-)